LDPHPFHADPAPGFQIYEDANPDPECEIFADPDPGLDLFPNISVFARKSEKRTLDPDQMRIRIWIQIQVFKIKCGSGSETLSKRHGSV